MQRGHDLEPEARRLYSASTGQKVSPACLQRRDTPWMRASPDGLCEGSKVVVEIKCGPSAYKRSSSTRSVPKRYYGQVQHILAVTGYDRADFWCWLPRLKAVLLTVDRNDDYIDRLIKREQLFWTELVARRKADS